MHFVVIVFSKSPDDLDRMLAPFDDDRFDYYTLNGLDEDWFVSKTGERTNSGFASELHFGVTSNRIAAEKARNLPGFVARGDAPAVISCLLRLTPYAFVTPNGDWVDSDDIEQLHFYKCYKAMVGRAKRYNYHVTAVDCHI